MTEKPYTGQVCSRLEHKLTYGRKIAADDTRLFACNCGSVLMGNGSVRIRPQTLIQRFPKETA